MTKYVCHFQTLIAKIFLAFANHFYNRTMQIVSSQLMDSTFFGKIAVDGGGLVLYFKETSI